MTNKARIEWTPAIINIVAAAHAHGIRNREIASILGVGKDTVQRRCRSAGHEGRIANQHVKRAGGADALAAVLGRIAAGEDVSMISTPEPARAPATAACRGRNAATSLAAELGIRVHTNGNGVSLPYLSSLYGGGRA